MPDASGPGWLQRCHTLWDAAKSSIRRQAPPTRPDTKHDDRVQHVDTTMSELRALLLTDVADSTALAQRLGDDAMAALWRSHDRVARDLLPPWCGREIDKTDGLLLLFDNAADAAGYALAYHRALATLEVPLLARAGLHVGAVSLHENSAADVALGAKPLELEGLAKSLAARVMSTALGGQTLLTAEARAALGTSALHIQSHGHWRMKGLAEPIELFELGSSDAPFTPPPDAAKVYRVVRDRELWLPVRQVRHGLPAERDAFVGRHDELVELSRRLDAGARLLSVLGMGGSGKTRFAIHFGWTWLGDFPGGAWFCDLSQARGVEGIVSAVAATLEVPLGKGDPVVQLGNAIAGRGPCLMILDNFEQIARHASDTLGRWLDRAGEARFVVTTREVLGLAGEQTLVLPPMLALDAEALFLRRTEAARADARYSAEDLAAIAPLVRLLDGLPLAIELAAARGRAMPPRMLLARMSERFRLLASTGGRQDRQATLRATFDWSWDLLTALDRTALAQLSVFEGGFSLEAAEAVLDLSGANEAAWPVDAVHSLVDKSFVRPSLGGRFGLLVSVQEYAAEHLRTEGRFDGSGPASLRAAQERHGAWFASLGEERAIADGCADLDNLVVACRRTVLYGKADLAVGALEGAWAALRLRGPFSAAMELAASVRSTPGLSAGAGARAESVAGHAAHAAGRAAEARVHYHAALQLAREVGDRHCEARVSIALGDLHGGDGRAEEVLAEQLAALSLTRAMGDRALEGTALNGLGTLMLKLGRMDDSHAYYDDALAVSRELGDRTLESGVLQNLGIVLLSQGKLGDAQRHYESSLVAARGMADRRREGSALCNLGLLHYQQGHLEAARVRSELALVVAREIGHGQLECIVLCNLGMVFNALALLGDARRAFEAALTMACRLEDHRSEGQILGYFSLLKARERDIDGARACLETGERLLRDLTDLLSLGLLQCNRAEVEQRAGDNGSARAALDQARSLAEQTGSGTGSELGMEIERVGALIASGGRT